MKTESTARSWPGDPVTSLLDKDACCSWQANGVPGLSERNQGLQPAAQRHIKGLPRRPYLPLTLSQHTRTKKRLIRKIPVKNNLIDFI